MSQSHLAVSLPTKGVGLFQLHELTGRRDAVSGGDLPETVGTARVGPRPSPGLSDYTGVHATRGANCETNARRTKRTDRSNSKGSVGHGASLSDPRPRATSGLAQARHLS